MRREEVLSQCKVWEKTLAEGIEKMQARGVATAHLKDYLRKLVKGVETLKAEIGKIEKKLSQTVRNESGTTEASCSPEVTKEETERDTKSMAKEETTDDSGHDGDRETTLDVDSTQELLVEKNMAAELETKSQLVSSDTPPQPGPPTAAIEGGTDPPTAAPEGEGGTDVVNREGGGTVEAAQHSCMSTDPPCGPQDHEQ